MRRPRVTLVLLGILTFGGVDAAAAQRSTRDGALVAAHRAVEGARGHQAFPTPRGASKARAERLGLGTLEVARRLLHHPPEEAWVRAARVGARTIESLRWPVDDGRFGRGFGYVRTTRPDLRHDGVDVVAPRGSVVRAVEDGIVAYSGDEVRGFGNCLMIVHPNGWVSVYAHNDRITVPAGYRVRRGERVAFVGATGLAQGPHVHFELVVGGRSTDPMEHFRGHPWKEARARWQAGELHARRDHLGAIEPDYSASFVVGAAPTGAERVDPARASATLSPSPSGVPEAGLAPDAGLADARRLLAHAPDERALEALDARLFGSLLWPVRGGRSAPLSGAAGEALGVRAEGGAAVRAAADGRVVYAGEGLEGLGLAIVLLHKNGWVTVYGGLGEIAVTPSSIVRRGEWMGHLGEGRPLRFELRDGGEARDPRDLLVQVPEGVDVGR
jgi:murein DD-endopeptidase MepM/ murein hydrolase activator NlpD